MKYNSIHCMSLLKKKHKIQKIVRELRFPFIRLRKRYLYKKVLHASNLRKIKESDRNEKIIVSLTSYPQRFGSIPIVIKSLLMQTVLPDKIIVWHDCDEKLLTDDMKVFEQYGVEFIKVEHDLGPHKKYFYALQKYKEDLVIVVDDDLIYPSDMIKTLMNAHINNPGCVCARRVHKIKFDEKYRITFYDNWIRECFYERRPSHLLMATSGAGTLYPPGSISAGAFDISNIKEKCLYGDDIWLKYFEILNNVRAVWASNSMPMPPTVDNSQENALSVKNVDNNRNNIYIEAMNEKYGDEITKIIKDEICQNALNIKWGQIKDFLGEKISFWGEE